MVLSLGYPNVNPVTGTAMLHNRLVLFGGIEMK